MPDAAHPPDAICRYAIRLALSFPRWVHRCTETFEFVDADTVRRRMTIDFTMPPQQGFNDGDTVFVPITILTKADLRNFDLTDASGTSLPLPTSDENGVIARRGFEQVMEALLPAGTEIPVEALDETILEADAATALKRARSRLVGRGKIAVALRTGSEVVRRQMEALLINLSSGFLLLVVIKYNPNERQLVKVSYDAAHRSTSVDADGMSGWTRFGRALDRKVNRFFSSLGLMARSESFSVQAGWAKSYHAEIIPPDDTYSVEAELTLDGRQVSVDDHNFRPHVRTRSKGGETQDSRVRVLIQAQREGLVVPLLVAASIIAGTLACIPQRAGHVDDQVLAALLLVPFALSAFYVRSAENSYVTSALQGVRLVAGVAAVAAVTIVALLSLGYLTGDTQEAAKEVTTWGAHASLLSSVLLAEACLGPWAAVGGRRIFRIARDASKERNSAARGGVAGALILGASSLYIGSTYAALWSLYEILPIDAPL